MAGRDDLYKILAAIDGKQYQKYKELVGTFEMGTYTLHVDRIQGSPSSEHSAMRATVPLPKSGFPADTYSNVSRRTALADLVARRFWESARTDLKSVSIPRPGQEILGRGSVMVAEKYIGVSFSFDLPAAGKNVAGKTATDMFKVLDSLVAASLFFKSYKKSKLYNHIETSENADHMRSVLSEKGLKSFVGNGSVLPRREDGLAPMIKAVSFVSPKPLEVTIDVPNGPSVSGMGIPRGMTVIAGGTGTGRTVLADAVYAGVHNHIPGDGRETVVTDDTAFYVSKADGRSANNVDMTVFARVKGDTLTSENLCGPLSASVSMAEAAEVGCTLFVMDEGSCYPAVLGMDPMLRTMMTKDEPVIPLSDLTVDIRSKISIIAVCGSDDAVSAADTVIVMSAFLPVRISRKTPRKAADKAFRSPAERRPLIRNNEESRTDTVGMRFPSDQSYVSSLTGIVDAMRERMDGSHTIRSLSSENVRHAPTCVSVRKMDVAMLMNRMTSVSMIRRS